MGKFWTAQKVKYLKSYYGKIPAWKIAKKLKRSEVSIYRRAKKLKLKSLYRNNLYLEKDILFLKQNYGVIHAKIISKKLKHPIVSIITKANQLGLRSLISAKNHKYTSQEINYLKKNYPNTNIDLLAEKLHRTKYSIQAKAVKLKILKEGYKGNYTEEELDFLRRNYGKIYSKDISKILNRNPDAIQAKAEMLGLSSNLGKTYFQGKNHSQQTLRLMSDIKLGNKNPFWNKHHSVKTKKKIRLKSKKMWKNEGHNKKYAQSIQRKPTKGN